MALCKHNLGFENINPRNRFAYRFCPMVHFVNEVAEQGGRT
jgi:hypothetical protein